MPTEYFEMYGGKYVGWFLPNQLIVAVKHTNIPQFFNEILPTVMENVAPQSSPQVEEVAAGVYL